MQALSAHSCLCGRTFTDQRGLTVHSRRCRRRSDILDEMAHKRKMMDAEEAAAKIRQEEERAREYERAQLREEEAAATFTPFDQPEERGRGRRIRRRPRALQDFLPSNLRELPSHLRPQEMQPPTESTEEARSPEPEEPVRDLQNETEGTSRRIETWPNIFGLFRTYHTAPSQDPDTDYALPDLCDRSMLGVWQQRRRAWWQGFGTDAVRNTTRKWFAPFMNASIFRLMSWFYSGSSMKSLSELDHLVNDVLLQEDFSVEDLRGFSATRELARLDEWTDVEDEPFRAQDGWHQSSVPIKVPCERTSFRSEHHAPTFLVPRVYHRRLLEVVRAACQAEASRSYHLVPFELRHTGTTRSGNTASASGDSTPEPQKTNGSQRVYSELYNSRAMNEAYDEIRKSQQGQDHTFPMLETVVIALMIWSDSTHLAQFGTASLWPIYVFFGNQSKYTRAKPSEFAAHHLAYIPSLPDTLQDWYQDQYGRPATANVLKHCRRELMQAIWHLLLDDDFIHAYHEGMVVTFADGVPRLVFPRIFTYSADYPEKVLLATLRFLAGRPCPRCFIRMAQIPDMGSVQDGQRRSHKRRDDEVRRESVELVRRFIFEKGRSLTSSFVEASLREWSWTTVRNAFSERLGGTGFDFHRMLVPDLLHEFELGVFKATFTHLLRILYAAGGNHIQDLNVRYRRTPTFGRDTIRRFVRNTSAMKKLAARDFEDILQCALPVFDGLLDEPFNSIILDLIFLLATWHALAKLRMHTDDTLEALRDATRALGAGMRRFKAHVCTHFFTRELPREEAARGRRSAALAGRAGATGRGRGGGQGRRRGGGNPGATAEDTATGNTGPRGKQFNLQTYKWHALADYPDTIEMFGTSDNYSTQVGELEHRRVKRFYMRTNKVTFVAQITRHERREEKLRKIHASQRKARRDVTAGSSEGHSSLPFEAEEPMGSTAPDLHHHISQTARYSEDMAQWLSKTQDDPAFQNWDFYARLKDHILARLEGQTRSADGEERRFGADEHLRVVFYRNRLFKHKVLRVNYTTYDCRRAQDSLNPRTQADVMVLSHDDETPGHAGAHAFQHYWYARILGIYHVMVQVRDDLGILTEPKRVDFLWVRWFGHDPDTRFGWQAKRLPMVGFVPHTDPEAFSFMDPSDVIRGVHLVPAFRHGTTSELLPGKSIVRPVGEDEDYENYYVNIFVDRDMFMRFRGNGIGHRGVQPSNSEASHTHSSASLASQDDEAEASMDTDVDSTAHGPSAAASLERLASLALEIEEAAREGRASDDEDDDEDDTGQEDYGYVSTDVSDDEEDGEDPESDTDQALGPEDGEDEDEQDRDDNFAGL